MTADARLKIIILDDHPVIMDGIRYLLEGSDRFVLDGQAKNFRELITLLAHPAGILMIDVNINGENILDKIPAIRKKQPGVKILVFTSYNSPSLVRKAFEQQVNGYLLKDTAQDELLEALNLIADGKVFISKKIHIPKKEWTAEEATPALVDDFEKKYNLTERETEILRLIAQSYTNKEIGSKLYISEFTVQTHRRNLKRKLNAEHTADLVRFAYENGISKH